LRDPVALTVTSDLDKQPWLPLKGVLKGRAMLTPIESKLVRADMELFGTEIGTDAVKAKTLSLEAQCYWPWLEITNARATFEDGSLALATARMDLENKLFSAGTLAFNGPLVKHWLPVGYSYEGLSLVAHFEGPINELRHTGNLDATNVASPYLLPVSLHADWRGRQEKLEGFKAVVSSGSSSLAADGSLSLATDQADLRLSSISLSTNRQPFMESRQPCLISFHYPTSQKSWQLGLGVLDLAGTGGNLSAEAVIDWPREGALHLSAQNLASTNFAGFVKATLPEINVHSLNASTSWTNSPAKFEVEFSATGKVQRYEVASTNQTAQAEPSGIVKDGQGRSRNRLTGQSLLTTPLSCEAKIAGDESGITVSNVVVRTAQADELAIRGFIPLAINPANATNLIDFLGKNPIQLNASIKPQAFIWDEIEDLTGIILIEPNLNVALSGNWDALEGQVRLSAQELDLQNPPSTMPTLSDLRVQVQLDQKSARIIQAGLLVQGQPATLAGQMPLGQGFWTGLRERKPPDWEQATAQLTIENAQIAAFEPLFPDLIAPQGTLSVDFSMNRGGKLDGTLVIAHARTRPLGEFGSLRDINVTLRCSESALRLEQASAKLSSADLALAGGAYFHGTDWLKGAIPPFELSLKGTQVPLVHRPDLIVRSDLLLAITKTNNAPPLISGLAHLRDSFYLSDLSALVPGKVAKPSARPPYFSIEEPSLADWRLAITVEGSKFMRVRSSLFDGEISANVNLQGTLKDPIALGNLRVDSGLVRFPFANLQVQQGLVNLTSENPYHPDLLVSATSKQFGYDIRMEVSGPVDAPIVQFTSNPPLSSEQIVLLVSSGQMPQAGYSLTPQQRAQTVALFLGRDVLSKLGFGDQPEQRLTIRTGEQISDQGKPTYNVEFKLSDRWALTGEYDRFSDYNFGVKWRIYSR
jgi:translocation and assembly module TamB